MQAGGVSLSVCWVCIHPSIHQHLENAFPGSNILVVTVTKGESKRVEDQADEETLKEAMSVLRDMFGPDIPDATDILVARWLNNRFQRGSYTNYPIIPNRQLIQTIKVSSPGGVTVPVFIERDLIWKHAFAFENN